MKTGSPALLSAYRRSSKHGHSVRQSRLYTGTTPPTPSSFVKFHASLKNSKWRNSVLWTARRIISKALTSLTRGFNSVFTEVQDGRLRPNRENRQFVNDLTALLCDSVHERFGRKSTCAETPHQMLLGKSKTSIGNSWSISWPLKIYLVTPHQSQL